ncbi:hypothetical protein Tco_0727591 [Tanacetum coccineum]|uniref:Xylulose kinase-1 n=1 Tax=Tanacetum coccineum TaxID=301880 RepID=A0ABQ4YL39_9ASTR
MANLEFCDKHNMVSYLKKPTGSEGFQEIVDFLNGSHIRYALTKNPTIYVSLIKKFWQTATVRTVDNDEQEITVTVDGKEFTITKASVRRHLQLAYVDGISVLPTTEIFDQFSLMGMLTIQAKEGEGSGHPSEPQPPPYTAQPTNEESIPNVVSSSHQNTQTPRQALNQVVVLCAKKPWGVPLLRLWSKRVPTLPHDSPLLIVNTLGSDEGNLKQTKQVYGAAYTKLIMKVKKLEKTVKTSHSRRRAKIVVSDNEEASEDSSKQGRMREKIDQDVGVNLVTHTQGEDKHDDQLGVLSATKVLADAAKTNVLTYTRRRRVVSNGSGGISTASRLFSTAEESVSTIGASMPVSTAAAQSFTEEEWENIRARVEADEELSRRLQAEERNKYSEVDQAKMLHMGSHTLQQLKRYSFDELKELFETTMKNVNTFIPMETEDRERASKLATRSSQATITDSAEVGSSKRAAEAELDHECI